MTRPATASLKAALAIALAALPVATPAAAGSMDRRIHKALRGAQVVERAELAVGKTVVLDGAPYGSRLFLTVNRLYAPAALRSEAVRRLAGLPGMPEGVLVVVRDEEARIVDRFPLGRPSLELPAGAGAVTATGAGPDGRVAAIATFADRAAIHLFDVATGAHVARIEMGRAAPVLAMAPSARGTLLVLQGRELLEATPSGLTPVRELARAPRLADIAAAAPTVALLGEDGTVRLLGVDDGRERFSFEPLMPVEALTISPAGDAVAIEGGGMLALWKSGSRTPLWRVPAPGGSLAFLEDALAVASEGQLTFFDTVSGLRQTP